MKKAADSAVPIAHPSDKSDYEEVNKLIKKVGARTIMMQAIQQATLSEIQEILTLLDDW